MSGLGNLFSNFSADSNDALKYSAPKEPKQRTPKQSSTPATPAFAEKAATVSVPSAPAVAAATPKAAGPSKIMASAAVRLYKVNPSTGAYDALEGGGLLGCVMMGTGLTFQILIYNGQKVPQATVAVGAGFDYALRDLYMSFADSAGNQWSLLFDSVEVMTTFVRTVAATVVHVTSHGDASSHSQAAVVRRSLPRSQQTGDEDGGALALGMSAGVYLTAWELQEVADYPGDIVAGAPLKRVQAPDDVVKIKLSATEELIGGLSEGLVGLKKGDKVVLGVPPQVFYRGSADGPIDLTKRSHPGSWMFLEVEVSKIKSTEKKTKDRKPFAEENPVPAPAPQQASPGQQQQTSVQRLAQRTSSFDEQSTGSGGGGSEIANRMAKLAAQSGGGGGAGGANMQLAGIMNNQNQQQRSPSFHQQQSQQQQYDPQQGGDNSNNGNNGNNQYQGQGQGQGRSNNNYNGNGYNNSNYSNSFDGGNNQQQQQQHHQQENRLAVIDGQGVRSYYDNDDAGMDSNNNNSNHLYGSNNGNYGHSQQQQQNYRNLNSGRPVPAPAAVVVAPSAQTDASLTQLHTSVAAVQQSMLQLHTKLDQVSTQVTSSVALQQQQLVVASSGGGAGAAGMGGMPNIASMGGMGGGMGMQMSPYMQQMQFQQQLMAQQQQQQMMGMGMMPSGTVTTTAGMSGSKAPTAARLKTEELVSTLQALLTEYERSASSCGGTGGGDGKAAAEALAREAEAKDTIRALKGSVERLEEKNEALQTRYDKLMSEKSALMEKYMEQFQTGSTASTRVLQMQAELEPLKSANRDLQAQVDQLRTAAAVAANNAGSSNRELEQEQKTLIAELKNKAMSLEVELMEARQARQTAEAVLTSSSGDLFSLQALTQQQAAEISALRGEATQLKAALDTAQAGAQHAVTEAVTSKEREVREELSAQHAAALEAGHSKIASLEASLATASASASTVDDSQIAALEGQVAQLKAQLAKSEENAVSLSQALDAVAAKATEANDQHAATVASLQAELESAKESASVAAASTAAGGKADAEDVKAIMQEIFAKACEVFDPEAEDAAVAQYSTKDIVKRLKAVLKKVTSERDNA